MHIVASLFFVCVSFTNKRELTIMGIQQPLMTSRRSEQNGFII